MPFTIFAKKHNNNGFTVIELIVVIAIIAILGLVSIGPLMRWRANNMIESNLNAIRSDMERAKIEAIRRSRNVSIVFTSDNTYTCFVDKNGNRVLNALDNDFELFTRTLDTRIDLQVYVDGALTGAGNKGFTFSPRGFLVGSNFGSIVIGASSMPSANQFSTITINRIGNVNATTERN